MGLEIQSLWACFWIAVVAVVVLRLYQRAQNSESATESKSPAFKSFQRNYLCVYLLAMFADWLKGPYVYALYASYGFPPAVIAQLFIAGFLSSMVVGTVVGALSDTYGRRLMCQAFAVCYFIAGCTKLYNDFYILLLGRVLSGIATSLLFSVFEAWMVCEHTKRGFSPALLSNTFSLATMGNGIIAVLAGLVASRASADYGFVAPFILCLIPLALVFIIVTFTWNENYGNEKMAVLTSFTNAWHAIRDDKNVACLGAAQAAFEGAMYTFVFMWTPALNIQGSHGGEGEGSDGDGGALGIIFATFMVCVMLGSSVFSLMIARSNVESIPFTIHAAAALCAMVPALFTEHHTMVYYSFLGFEVVCGMFFPTFGTMRGKYVAEETRASVMNFFRIPLNAFVVIILLNADMSTSSVFMICVCAHLASLFFYSQFNPKQAPASSSMPPVASDDSTAPLIK